MSDRLHLCQLYQYFAHVVRAIFRDFRSDTQAGRISTPTNMAAATLMSASLGMAEPRIVIAGAGLHGSALAYYLTQRGETPLVVERHSVAAAAANSPPASPPETRRLAR